MELGRRSRERPAGGGEHLRTALLRPPGLQVLPMGPRVGSTEETYALEQPAGRRRLSNGGISSSWDQAVGRQQAPMPHTVTPPCPTPACASRPTSPGTIPDPPPRKKHPPPRYSPVPHCRVVIYAQPFSPPRAKSSMWTKCDSFGLPQSLAHGRCSMLELHGILHAPLLWNRFPSCL